MGSWRVMVVAASSRGVFDVNLYTGNYTGYHNYDIRRGSYMSDYILFNSLNELKKIDKMRGLLNNRFNNTSLL